MTRGAAGGTVALWMLGVLAVPGACGAEPMRAVAPPRETGLESEGDGAVADDAASSSAAPAVDADRDAPAERIDGSPAAAQPHDAVAVNVDASTPATPTGPFPVYCFGWVHQRDFSTDCFRSRAACEQQQKQMGMGHRDTTGCERRDHAACTTVRPSGEEHCFGDLGNCARYRRHVQRIGGGAESDACVAR